MSDPSIEILLAGVRTALTLLDVLAHARERRADRRKAGAPKPCGEAENQGNEDGSDEGRTRS